MSDLLPESMGGQTSGLRVEQLTAQLMDAYDQGADELEIAMLNRKIFRALTAIEYPEPPRFYEPDEHTSGISLVAALATIVTSYIRA